MNIIPRLRFGLVWVGLPPNRPVARRQLTTDNFPTLSPARCETSRDLSPPDHDGDGPLFALLVALGGTGAALIYHLGGRIDNILRENYDSVVYMRDLNEALERMDSLFQFALAGREKEAREQYETNWKRYALPCPKSSTISPCPGRRSGRHIDGAERQLPPARRGVFRTQRANQRTGSTSAGRNCRGSMAGSARSRTFQERSCSSTRTTWKRPTGRPAAWPVPR